MRPEQPQSGHDRGRHAGTRDGVRVGQLGSTARACTRGRSARGGRAGIPWPGWLSIPSPLNSAAIGSWFRADAALLTLWPQLGLPTESRAGAVASPPAAAVAPVAATRPATVPAAWLWVFAAAAVLTAGGWLGVRWRRHGQLLADRDNPPGESG
jgi:hypothetical protein